MLVIRLRSYPLADHVAGNNFSWLFTCRSIIFFLNVPIGLPDVGNTTPLAGLARDRCKDVFLGESGFESVCMVFSSARNWCNRSLIKPNNPLSRCPKMIFKLQYQWKHHPWPAESTPTRYRAVELPENGSQNISRMGYVRGLTWWLISTILRQGWRWRIFALIAAT